MRAVIAMASLAWACSPSFAAPSGGPAIDGWVLDGNGAVAAADVRVVAMKPQVCACKVRPDDASYDNAVPECACPAELAALRKRLAACTWPSTAVRDLRSDTKGRVSLGSEALGTMIEATTPSGVAWVPMPAKIDRVALELAKPVVRTLRVNTKTALRAALLFDDGHCMPFRRAGDTQWVTVAPIPHLENVYPTLVIEAAGFATLVRSWYEGGTDPLDLELHAAQPVTGTCNGDTVTLDNVFQRIVARVDGKHRFSIKGALDIDSTVTCTKQGTDVEEWRYTPADGLNPNYVVGGVYGGSCQDVVVVDRAGKPLAGAEVTYDSHPGVNGYGGTIATADGRGRACVEDVYGSGELVVHPPLALGGWCAGESRLKVTKAMLGKPIRIAIDPKPLPRTGWRGRLQSPEKLPVAGATIAVRDVAPQNTSCTSGSDVVVASALDGTFELPAVPLGDVELYIQHDWYTEQTVSIKVPSAERTFTMDRGITWTGRVVDAQGKTVDRCDLYLTLASQHILTAKCSANGFSFTTLVPGDVKVGVHITVNGKLQTHEQKFTIKAGTAMKQDIALPP